MRSVLSVRNMIDMYVCYGLEEETWDMLYNMTLHGLIDAENWKNFYNICAGWRREGSAIIDENEKVVYADVQGYWVKA